MSRPGGEKCFALSVAALFLAASLADRSGAGPASEPASSTGPARTEAGDFKIGRAPSRWPLVG